MFKAGETSVSVLLDSTNTCVIPWEVLQIHGRALFAGVYGTTDGDIVLPTTWANLGIILDGVALGEDAHPPSADLWEQALAQKADGLDYDGLNLSLMSGSQLLAAVPIVFGGENGVTDHRLLTGRDAAEQHPVSAITGLEGEIRRIPAPVEPLTNLELEELLK